MITKQMCTFIPHTMPFWTLNPNWYFVSGLLTTTWTVGGQDTAFITTLVPGREFFRGKSNYYQYSKYLFLNTVNQYIIY